MLILLQRSWLILTCSVMQLGRVDEMKLTAVWFYMITGQGRWYDFDDYPLPHPHPPHSAFQTDVFQNLVYIIVTIRFYSLVLCKITLTFVYDHKGIWKPELLH